MTTDRDTTGIVRSWLRTEQYESADRVLDAVLDRLDATPQRRARSWPVPAFPEMSNAMKLGLAAAAVTVAALLGLNYLGGQNVGTPNNEAPQPSPTASPAARLPIRGELRAGTYKIDTLFPADMTLDVPAGLGACGGSRERGICASDTEGLSFMDVTNVVTDPCDPSRSLRDPPVGPSVDDLIVALGQLPRMTVSQATDITVDGYSGKEVEVTAPATAVCAFGPNGYGTWSSGTRVNGVGPGEINVLRILDVDGTRVVIALAHHPGQTPVATREALEAVIDSIRFE